MVIDGHLRTWLSFDDANNKAKDNVGNLWNWYNAATIVTEAVHGTAVKLQSASVYSRNPMQLGGADFTIQFHSRVTQTSSSNVSGVFSLSTQSVNTASGQLFQLKDVQQTGEYVFDHNTAGAPISSVSELTSYNTGVTAPNSWTHVAIVYQHTSKKLTLFLGGVKAVEYTLSNGITRQGWYHHIGLSRSLTNGNAQYGYCTIDEFSVHDGVALYTENFTPPDSSYYDEIVVDLNFDIERQFIWRYVNPGRADLLTISGGTTLTDLPASQSATGVAYYQPSRAACFGVAPTKELWLTCDIYTTANYTNGDRIRMYSDDGNGVNGFCSQTPITTNYQIWHNNTGKNGTSYFSKDKKRAFMMHMVSDVTNGLIECSIGSDTLSYTGNVNNGNDFANFYIQMDGSNIWVSNLIISNAELTPGGGFHTVLFDAERFLSRSLVQIFDTERQIVPQELSVSADFDLFRVVVTSTSVIVDTERDVQCPVEVESDTQRVLLKSVEAGFDAQRVLLKSVGFDCDVWRQLPHTINGNSAFLQSVTIGLQEQQLTDNVSFVMAGDIGIMEAVNFYAWDYNLMGRVEQTSKRGVLISCQCTCDVDEILYRQMAYTIPENAFEWTTEYNEAYNNYVAEHQDEEINKMPCAPASAHITAIANSLGKSVVIQFDDWVSTMSTDVKSGTNYGGLIEELFGWTARLPHIMINCYMRGGTIYAVQRGHESNTVSLDDKELTVHTVTKKLVRTTWGSDTNSSTEVVPVYDSWYSDNLTPWPPEEEEPGPSGGGGVTHGDDGLVKETEVVHGDERVITTYEYESLGGGQKFLSKEKTVTIIGNQRVDEVTTYHKPVSHGQSQVYSTDEDSVLGTTVSPSNFDDRVSPYQYQHMVSGDYSGGGYTAAFAGGAYDQYGNYYTAVYDAAGNRYLITGHTLHEEQIGQRTRTRLNAYALLDTSFPVSGYDKLSYLTEQIKWLDRKTEESVTLELYNCQHLVDFNDKIVWHGNTYFLRSNTATRTETIVNQQTLEFVRWY